MSNILQEFLRRPDASPMFASMFGMLTIVLGIGVPFVAHYWYKLRIRQWEMSLKHTMLERGMSAADIKAVLEASTPGEEKKHGCGRGWR